MLSMLGTKSITAAGSKSRAAVAVMVRYKSAVVTPSAESSKEGKASCPFTGHSRPVLKSVPKIPLFGSMIHQISGTPPFLPHTLYDYERLMRAKFGEFYSVGFPMFGKGILGTLHSITSPSEMLKVIRMEGAYPSGLVNNAWTFAQALKDDGSAMISGSDNGLLGTGERWKQQRTFLQTGMLDPRAARAFVPGIAKAAELASKGAPVAAQQNQLNYYLNLCAFDMFSSFMFGEVTNCAATAFGSETKLDAVSEENMIFCKAAVESTNKAGQMGRSPTQFLAHKLFGYKTKKYHEFYESWSTVRDIGMKKLNTFVERYRSNQLNEYEKNSYMANALERMDRGETQIGHDEMMQLCFFALFVGVDTTSGVTSWNLTHLALNPSVQDKLYNELVKAVKETDGKITPKTLEKKNTPYLHACLRENYRLTPPFAFITTKRASQGEVDIHGVHLPQDSVLALKNKFNDPAYLEDAYEFKPERWMQDAVDARVGTDLEEMDHALFRDSFGQGARRCPGSRVATNEMLCLISQLVLDYEIRAPPHYKTWRDVPYDATALITPIIPQLEFKPRTFQDSQQAA